MRLTLLLLLLLISGSVKARNVQRKSEGLYTRVARMPLESGLKSALKYDNDNNKYDDDDISEVLRSDKRFVATERKESMTSTQRSVCIHLYKLLCPFERPQYRDQIENKSVQTLLFHQTLCNYLTSVLTSPRSLN